MSRIDGRALRQRIALIATLGLTASGEITFAIQVGWPAWIAWLMAVSLDIYVLCALEARRDVGVAIALMALTNVGAHTVAVIPGLTEGTGADKHPVWWLVAAASVLPPVVLWRVHRLIHNDHGQVTEETTEEATESPAVVHTEPAPQGESSQVSEVPAEVPAPEAVHTEDHTEEPTRVSAEEAKRAIYAGWAEGRPAAEVAREIGRDRSYVSRVYRRLDRERGPQIPGQMTVDEAINEADVA